MNKLMHLFWVLLLSAALLAATGCSSLLGTPTPTALPSLTPTFTDTIAWFPATDTPTPTPTVEVLPTTEMLPGLGASQFTDDFSDPALWSTSISDAASAVIGRNMLTLGISGVQPGAYLFTTRSQPVLQDFYAGLTATLSLCQGADEYGMVFRLMDSDDYYRYALNCKGQSRLERIRSGQIYPMQNWATSSQVPTGAPGLIHIGVWASQNEFRVFLNGEYQSTVHDPLFTQGRLGVFVLAGGSSPLVVSYSELQVYQVAYTTPLPSPTPTRTPRPTRTP
jgi:hypothetical protein